MSTTKTCDACGTVITWAHMWCETDAGDEWHFCDQECFWVGHEAHGWPPLELTNG